ncbi:MAG: glutamate-5-semialdehyde dehydrogenase [Oscillibacter sp.]|nr:glutamate-5-semialdehyde dehydrogenase [Oscillibacter sp.]
MRATREILEAAKAAAPVLAAASSDAKNKALSAIADRLFTEQESILSANREDMEQAKAALGAVMADRLLLTPERIAGMAAGIRDAAALPDPVGRVLRRVERPNGLIVEKVAVPLGVIAIIYESRPNVTSDAAALALKAGSAVMLRGGKEAFRSNAAIARAIRLGLADAGFPPELAGFVEDTSRDSARELMEAEGLVDLLIPRGGAGLIRSCMEHAKVPCIQTGTGICHIYVDASANQQMALDIIDNAKTSRPSVCNAEEVLLVHRGIAAEFLPKLRERLVVEREKRGLTPVELRLDSRALEIIPGTPANERDFDTEFLDYILAVGVVDSADDAIKHIGRHSTGHSDAIITQDSGAAERFTRLVDSAAVYVNASTRFTDGGEFGLGCEMGISTQKLHARGPMGLEELTSYKYVVRGDGQTR